MFKAYVDGVCFYDDRLEENTITGLSLKLEENKGGSFEFTLYPDNPWYASFEKLVSTVVVRQDEKIIFRGRVLDSEESFFRERKITCEGEYAFFNDGIFYPLGSEPVEATSDDEEDQAGTRYTPIEIFTQIITDYNSQVPEDRRFNVGSISIKAAEEEIDYWNLEFKPSIDAMDDLIEQCGGHVIFRHDEESGVVYIDWTDDYQLLDQSVEFGRNLLDLTQTIQADELVTAILAHGETDENRNIPTNISHMNIPATETHMQMGVVPEGPDDSRDEQFGPYGILLVNVPLYQQYGLIIEERSYDGYPADWVDQLIEDVDGLTGLSNSIEVEAVDLAWLGSGEPFEIGRAVKVTSDRHGVSDEYHITKIDVDLQDPSSSKITFGKTLKNFVEQIVDADRKPIDGQSIKVTGYQFDYAVSDSGLTPPDDSEFADTYTPESGKWLWTRVTTKFNDGSSTKCYYPSYQGEDAKTFRIKTDNTVVVRNDRLLTSQTIVFTAEVNGYTEALPIWYVGSEKIGEGGTVTRSIPYKGAEAFTVSLYNGTVLMDTLTLTAVDKSGGAIYLGICDSAVPTYAEDIDGNHLLLMEGDYFLAVSDFDSYEAGNPYRWNGEAFVSIERGSNVTDHEWAAIINGCLDDAINSNQSVDTKFYSWFKTFATKEGFARFLVVYRLLMGSGTPTEGLYFLIADVDENGNKLNIPIFKCLYNGVNLFSIDFSVPQVVIGDYFNKGGLIWDGLKQELSVNGSGRFSGLLDTVTIKTADESNTNYFYGNINSFDDFVDLVDLAQLTLNKSFPLSGTINGVSIAEITIGNITTVQGKKRFYHHSWSSSWGLNTAYNVGNLPITIKDANGNSYRYVVRKVYVYAVHVAWNNTSKYPPYPPIITDLKRFLSLHDWAVDRDSSGSNDFSEDYDETSCEYCSSSDFQSYGDAKIFPYALSNVGYYDSITERLYIYNLPNAQPSDSNRVWVDSEGYLRLT